MAECLISFIVGAGLAVFFTRHRALKYHRRWREALSVINFEGWEMYRTLEGERAARKGAEQQLDAMRRIQGGRTRNG